MYFKVSKSVFYNALSTVSRAISSFSPLPAFSGIKIEAKLDHLVLTGSDSDISIQTTIHSDNEETLQINDTGSIVIEAKYILEIVRKIDSDELELEILDGTQTKISGKTAEFKINGMNSMDYPMIDFIRPANNFTINSDILKEIISQTSFATSTSETRPALTGVNFFCEGHTMRCVGTDSYRLAKKVVEIEKELTFNITIPSRNLNEVSKTLEADEEITVAISDRKAQFILKNTVIQTRLIDGVFPDISRLIPLAFDYELEIDTAEILGAIDRASFIKSDGVSVIKLSLDEKACILSSRSQEVGSSTENLSNAVFKGEHLDISFNGRYVFEALKAIRQGKIRFSFCGEMKPFVIQPIEDDSILQLVLPVRTYA